MKTWMPAAMAALIALASALAAAQNTGHSHGSHAAQSAQPASSARDGRLLVKFPDVLRNHTLSNMRDHLQVMADLQGLLAVGAFDKAADLAESRLGMSSLPSHGAHDVAKYMPKGMQEAGTAMHRSASRFARMVTDASLSGDVREPLKGLAELSRTCVACHAGYRLH